MAGPMTSWLIMGMFMFRYHSKTSLNFSNWNQPGMLGDSSLRFYYADDPINKTDETYALSVLLTILKIGA